MCTIVQSSVKVIEFRPMQRSNAGETTTFLAEEKAFSSVMLMGGSIAATVERCSGRGGQASRQGLWPAAHETRHCGTGAACSA